MNELMKTKRKLHYLLNYLFYFLFFGAGFLLGGGSVNNILEMFNK